MLVSIKNY